MLGRGTRLCPDLFGPGHDKTDFFVFDFCGNFEYFSEDPPAREGSNQKSLTERLFTARVQLARALREASDGPADLLNDVIDALHAHVTGMTLDNVLVRPHRREVEKFSDREAWADLSDDEALTALAGLPTATRDSDAEALRFDLIMTACQLAVLTGQALEFDRLRRVTQDLAARLLEKISIPMVAAEAERLQAIATDDWWTDVTPEELEVARLRLRGLMRLLEAERRDPIYTDFADTLTEARPVKLPAMSSGIDIRRFTEKSRVFLQSHHDDISIQRLRRNKPLTQSDLDAFEALLLESGADKAIINAAAARAGGLGLFVRSLVGLDRAAAQEAFMEFISDGTLNDRQLRFLDLIIAELTSTGVMAADRLFESPYTDVAPAGPDSVFPGKVEVIVDILHRVRNHAMPQVS